MPLPNPKITSANNTKVFNEWRAKGIQTMLSIYHQEPSKLKSFRKPSMEYQLPPEDYRYFYNQLTKNIRSCYSPKRDPFQQSVIDLAIKRQRYSISDLYSPLK